MTERERRARKKPERAAYHEAGHAVAAYLGICAIEAVFIETDPPSCSGLRWPGGHVSDGPYDAVSAAGVVASSIRRGHKDVGIMILLREGEGDFACLLGDSEWAISAAWETLAPNFGAVVLVAEALLERGALTWPDVARVLTPVVGPPRFSWAEAALEAAA